MPDTFTIEAEWRAYRANLKTSIYALVRRLDELHKKVQAPIVLGQSNMRIEEVLRKTKCRLTYYSKYEALVAVI